MSKVNAEFRAYYDHFRSYPPLRPTEERRLLHVIKGLQPPVDYDGMARMWGRPKENGSKAAIDKLWLTPIEKMWGVDEVEDEFPVSGTCRLPTPEEQSDAIKQFVMHNMRLVLSRVLKFRHQEDREVMEIVSYGTDGLYRAIELFDLSRGTRFSTYAVHWIESQIRKGLTFVEGQKPPRLKKLTSKFKKAEKELTKDGKRPTHEAVAEHLNWGTKTLHVFQTSGISNVPIETFDAEDEATDPIPEGVEKREIIQALHDNMHVLEAFEEDIIRRHYGFGYPEETLQGLANTYGVTKERIRQIENGGLHKLYMKVRHFRDPDD